MSIPALGYAMLVTHLHPEDSNLRTKEAQQIVKFVEAGGLPTLAVGDMNTLSRRDAFLEETGVSTFITQGTAARPPA